MTQIAVLSDIHANFPALEAVVTDAQSRGVTEFWFLGDVVGYGPHPADCLDWLLREVADENWVVGNHDAMMLGLYLQDYWQGSKAAQEEAKLKHAFAFAELKEVNRGLPTDSASDPVLALQLNLASLSDASQRVNDFWRTAFDHQRLEPKQTRLNGVVHQIVHASSMPNQYADTYIYPWTRYLLETELKYLDSLSERPFCQWHGHTHVPYLLRLDAPLIPDEPEGECIVLEKSYSLGKNLTLVNPGSVGQPRNHDTRACYAILDSEQNLISLHRVAYELFPVEYDLIRGNYPTRVVERLQTARGNDGMPIRWKECLESQSTQTEKGVHNAR